MVHNKFLYGFIRVHENVNRRQREATLLTKIYGFNNYGITEFIDVVLEVFDASKLGFTWLFVWTTMQKKTRKITSQRGKLEVGPICAWEGNHTTRAASSASAA
jgi:hypothetical protein